MEEIVSKVMLLETGHTDQTLLNTGFSRRKQLLKCYTVLEHLPDMEDEGSKSDASGD